MNRLLGYAMVWVAVNGAITFGAGEGMSDRLGALGVALPAWAYIGFRIRQEIRGIKEDDRQVRARRRRGKHMMLDELVDAVAQLVVPGARRLECREDGHGPGHVCLAQSEELSLADLVEALSSRYGSSRNLAMGGYTDPTVDATTGRPLLVPFGADVVDMRAWAQGSSWIGAGTVRTGDDARRVVLVAERAVPAVELLPADASWVERVVAVTGWAGEARTVDWDAVEGRLGTRLPSDYKQLAEIFPDGAFDGYLKLYGADCRFPGEEFAEHTAYLFAYASCEDRECSVRHDIHPALGRVLQWGASLEAERFYWLAEGDDPDRWAVLATDGGSDYDAWTRFPGTAAEFVFRMLTERSHPFSTARYFDTHWFERHENNASYESHEDPDSGTAGDHHGAE
ncbi:hypothetical protein ACWFR5_15430 [Streptomyces sp. NPDC055092]